MILMNMENSIVSMNTKAVDTDEPMIEKLEQKKKGKK